MYPSESKLKKQMKYAHSRSVKYVLMRGDQELKNGIVKLKIMETGEQVDVPDNKIYEYFK
jgi:histidyl-tRNA synthetase